jgi:hypothetical protein
MKSKTKPLELVWLIDCRTISWPGFSTVTTWSSPRIGTSNCSWGSVRPETIVGDPQVRVYSTGTYQIKIQASSFVLFILLELYWNDDFSSSFTRCCEIPTWFMCHRFFQLLKRAISRVVYRYRLVWKMEREVLMRYLTFVHICFRMEITFFTIQTNNSSASSRVRLFFFCSSLWAFYL